MDGSIITGGTGIIGSAINAITTSIQNKKAREFAVQQYNTQRKDALADWNMQNAYNSPAAQMQRYKDAGLNPNLIYGQQTTSPTVRASSAASWKPERQNIGGDLAQAAGAAVSAYQDTAIKKQTLSNMEAQNRLLDLQATKLIADTNYTNSRDSNVTMKTAQGKALFDDVQLSLKAKIDQIRASTNLAEWKGMSAQSEAGVNLDLQQDRVKFFRANLASKLNELDMQETKKTQLLVQLENMKKDGRLKDFELELNKQGLTKNDPAWSRALATLLQKAGINVSDMIATKIASWLR